MKLDREVFIDILTGFEEGQDLSPDNPFDAEEIFSSEGLQLVDGPIRAFLEGNTIPETLKYVHVDLSAPPEDVLVPFAIAGMLQGLAMGFDYARRTT